MCAFNPDIEWMLPEGQVPYIENDAPDGTEHTRLDSEGRLLYNFVKRKVEGPNMGSGEEYLVGNPELNDMKRETMFIQLLEGLSAGEAQCLCLAKDRTLHRKYKGLNANTVRDAFNWDENFIDHKLVADRAEAARRFELVRTPADVAESQRYV